MVAVVGQEEKDGEFLVKDVMVAGLPPQKPLPSASNIGWSINMPLL